MATREKATDPSGNVAGSTGHRASLRLTIDGTEYAMRGLTRAQLPVVARRGFRLSRTDSKGRRFAYVVTAGPLGLSCSCKSVVYRSGPAALGPDPICKHSRALAVLGLLP